MNDILAYISIAGISLIVGIAIGMIIESLIDAPVDDKYYRDDEL